MLDWLIIGGGIHGVHIAARLIGEAGVAPDRLRIVDPADRLLARWRTSTATTGMTHLRSPSDHHLDLNPRSLERFAFGWRSQQPELFTRPYNRPALDLFNAHCDRVVEAFGLAERHIKDRAVSCVVDGDGVAVRLSGEGELEARNIVLAIGATEQPDWPAWAPRHHERVHHIFESGFDGWPPLAPATVAVVGGGLSAVQAALRLDNEGHQVHLISRHALRQHQFDSDHGWLEPKYMTGFSRERDLGRRRAMIAAARHRGSVPPDIRRALRQAIDQARLSWRQSDVERLDIRGDGLRLRLSTGEVLDVERLLLATGFAPERPGCSMVDGLIASASLPCADCGYPIVDAAASLAPRDSRLGSARRTRAGAGVAQHRGGATRWRQAGRRGSHSGVNPRKESVAIVGGGPRCLDTAWISAQHSPTQASGCLDRFSVSITSILTRDQ